MTDDLHHLTAAYSLDALDPHEQEAFEAHYPSCEACATEVAELRETAAVLASAVAVAPPPKLRAAVMAGIAVTRQSAPTVPDPRVAVAEIRPSNGSRSRFTGRFPPRFLALAAAIAIVAGVAGGLWATVGSRSGDPVDDLIAAPDAVTTELASDGGSSLRVVWSAERDQAAVIGTGLTDPGTGQTYELWASLDGAVAPAGLFAPVGGEVRMLLDLDDLDAEGWGVTVEPEGGSPQPTSEILYFGTL
jgi:anti-sigma-K factor RskA